MSSVRTIKRNLNLKRWAAIIADRNTTDLTVDEYCKRNNLSRHSYFYWLRLLRQESAGIGTNDSVPVEATTEANSIVELVPSGKKDILVPVVIPEEDKTAKDAEDSLRISIDGIDIYADTNTSEELLTKVIRVIRYA